MKLKLGHDIKVKVGGNKKYIDHPPPTSLE